MQATGQPTRPIGDSESQQLLDTATVGAIKASMRITGLRPGETPMTLVTLDPGGESPLLVVALS